MAIPLGMIHAKETEISALAIWAFGLSAPLLFFFYLSWVPYDLQIPDAAKVKQIKNWPKVLPTTLGCIITKKFLGEGVIMVILTYYFATTPKKMKLKNQVRKTEKSL